MYIATPNLFSGMILGRPVHYYDAFSHHLVSLPKGSVLTDLVIKSMTTALIDGVYVDSIPSEIPISHTLSDKLKTEVVNNIEAFAKGFMNHNMKSSQIDDMMNTTTALVNEVSGNKNVMVNILDLKMYDDYTYHHSLSVAVMALAIGMELGFDKKNLDELTLSGLLHDIGKVAIPLEIINKPGRLTPQEFEVVRQHPVNAGVYLFQNKLVSGNTFKGILTHHEKFNGTGYPNGIKGTDIPIFGRILAVADVYDALTSDRPYRDPASPTEAMEYIMGGAGYFFDLDVVKAFLRRITPYPVGSKVFFTDGSGASVVQNTPQQPLRPIVKLFDSGDIVDLYNDPGSFRLVIKGLWEQKDRKVVHAQEEQIQ